LPKSLCVDVSQGAQGEFATFAKVLDRHHGKVFAKGVDASFRSWKSVLKAPSFMVLTHSHGTPVQAPDREGITLHNSCELVVL
jgi:hypothetical protein